jgi:hypothetical protein
MTYAIFDTIGTLFALTKFFEKCNLFLNQKNSYLIEIVTVSDLEMLEFQITLWTRVFEFLERGRKTLIEHFMS